MIEVKNLVKRYGSHLAVDHLSFVVEKGQIYGFLGPNGAGKSTTMNIMTGYLGATEGEVLVNGHDMLKEPEEAKKLIGYLPEIPPLYTDMTVREYLAFAAELKKVKKAEIPVQVDQVMEMVKLEDVQHRLIRNLSKGYKQRVGLAQAVLGFPEIIILDEPTVGLDPKQIIEIRQLIRELAKKHTVILSSHILAEVREVCDHVMIISKGKLVASDTPDNLERLIEGEDTLELEVKGSRSQVEEILKEIQGVKELRFYEPEDGVTGVQIQIADHREIREELFYALAEKKCPLYRMQMSKATLEDVFLELTQNENEDEAAARSAEAGIGEDPILEDIDPEGEEDAGYERDLQAGIEVVFLFHDRICIHRDFGGIRGDLFYGL